MARDKGAEKEKKSGGSSGAAHAVGHLAGRLLHPLLPLLILGLLYGILALLLWRPVRSDPQGLLTREQLLQPLLTYQPRPAWWSDSDLRQVAQLGLVGEGRSVFEPGLAAELAQSYASSPWIESVGAVRVRYPAAVGVERLVPRVPFARINGDGGYVVVDRKGFVLPLAAGDLGEPAAGNAGAGRVSLPSIAGLRARVSPAQARVTEPEVLEALALLETASGILARAPGKPVAARVAREPAGTWRVHSNIGLIVEWGYWDDAARPQGEPACREKKELLARRLSECDPRRLQYIRLYAANAPVVPKGS